MTRVFLVDDQTLVRKGIRSLLSLLPDIEIAGEAVDGREALRLIPAAAPDVVLLDITMPNRIQNSPRSRVIHQYRERISASMATSVVCSVVSAALYLCLT